jgi:hypothetical protein
MELITADLSVNTIRRVIINACIHVSGRERVKRFFSEVHACVNGADALTNFT